MFNIILYFFMAFGVIAAIYAVNTSSVVKAVFAMFATFFSVSALLILAHAEFLAIAHLMVYIGGIIVVMIFAMMLSSKNIIDDTIEIPKESSAFRFTKLISGIASIAIFILLANVILSQKHTQPLYQNSVNTIQQFGTQLLSNYAFPLEIISLLLLVALMAASIITRKENKNV